MDGDHDDYDDDADREGLPSVSRLDRGGARRYRVLRRASGHNRGRDHYSRQRKQLPVVELIGILIKRHGLTDEVRQRAVCLYWPEIAGERIASKTSPLSFSERVLHLSAITSSWVQEMQFFKAQLITDINGWINANRAWLGPPPIVTHLRVALDMQRRERLVDPDQAQRLRHLRRLRPSCAIVPPVASDADREAIQRETSCIIDAELRAVIDAVRLKWNR
jgi:hypothetical protein